MNIDNSFRNNRGSKYGVVGIAGFAYINFLNTSFIGNTARYGGSMAFIFVGHLYIEDIIIYSSNSIKEGGALYFLKSKVVNIINSIFVNVSSKRDAGCIYSREINQLYIQNITVLNSSTYDKGGMGYFMKTYDLKIQKSIFQGSSASYGGILFFDVKTNAFINNSYFSNANSIISGGFAYVNGFDMSITILNSLFHTFFSEQDAAVLLSSNILNLTIAYSSFSSSFNKNGGIGIIYLDGYSDGIETFFNFYNVSFFNNSALYGANIYYNSNSRLSVINISSHTNYGSLFTFESDSSSTILLDSSLFTLANFYSSDWIQDSLIISFKCFIRIINTKICFNKGTKHLFELIIEVILLFNNSHVSDYFSFKKNDLSSFSLKNRIFYLLNSKLNSSNSRVVYSNIDDKSFQCAYFEILNSTFISKSDSYQNYSSSEVPFFLSSFKSHIEIEDVIFNLSTIMDSTFSIKKSNFTLNKILIKFRITNEKAKISFLFNIDGLDITIKENFVKFIDCSFKDNSISIISIRDISTFIIINCSFVAMHDDQIPFLSRAIEVINVNFLSVNRFLCQNYINVKSSCLSIISLPNINTTVNIISAGFLRNVAYFSSVLYVRGNISLLIDNCTFNGNKAILSNLMITNNGKGGCIIVDCEYYTGCSALFIRTLFENNYAATMGPTILFKGSLNMTLTNVTFINNFDRNSFTSYSSSFPILNYVLTQKLTKELLESYYQNFNENVKRTSQILSEYRLESNLTIASGQSFRFSHLITDAFNQQIISDYSLKSILTCAPAMLQNNSRLMIDKGYAFSQRGFFFFEKVTITFRPFSLLNCNITYEYHKDLIFDSRNPSDIKLPRSVDVKINIFVRECLPGELYQIDETCFLCTFGTYAFHNPNIIDLSKKCILCPANAYCNGGKYLSPMRGYWRINNQSSLIQKCLNVEACLGVGDSVEKIRKYQLFDNLTELQKTQGICGSGYEGNLCYYCQKGLARFKANAPCQNCEGLIIIYIKMALSSIFIILYVNAQVKTFSTIEKQDPHFALLIKMILNHFQTMSLMDLIDLGWTYDFNIYFSIKDYLSFLSEDFFVIDCIIQEVGGNLLVNKIIFTLLLPLILSLFMLLFWFFTFLLSLYRKKSVPIENACIFFSEKMRITLLIFIFILYPEIVKKGFSLINCMIIDEVTNLEVLANSPDVVCWSSEHTFWVLTVSLPGIIVWGIFTPLFLCLIIMIYNKNIYHLLHHKEYNLFMKIVKSKKYKKYTVLKNTVINIEKELADKLFTGHQIPPKTEIGYIRKSQKYVESFELKVAKKEDLEKKLNLNCLQKEIKIQLPNMRTKKGEKRIKEEEVICRNSETIIKEPLELLNILSKFTEAKDLVVTKEDLNLYKVLVQEEYNIEYDYQKKKEIRRILTEEPGQIKIPMKTMIIIRNFGFIYRGYRKEYFYWEIFMFSRKFIFIFIGKCIF